MLLSNLFRDQLDRYGELETTAAHIRRALVKGPEGVTAVLNADDPMVAALGDGLPRVVYAGLDDPTLLQPELSHGADAKFCPRCGSPFVFDGVYFGHVGHYHCPRGDFARPSPDVRATSVAIEGMERMRLRISEGAQAFGVEQNGSAHAQRRSAAGLHPGVRADGAHHDRRSTGGAPAREEPHRVQ